MLTKFADMVHVGKWLVVMQPHPNDCPPHAWVAGGLLTTLWPDPRERWGASGLPAHSAQHMVTVTLATGQNGHLSMLNMTVSQQKGVSGLWDKETTCWLVHTNSKQPLLHHWHSHCHCLYMYAHASTPMQQLTWANPGVIPQYIHGSLLRVKTEPGEVCLHFFGGHLPSNLAFLSSNRLKTSSILHVLEQLWRAFRHPPLIAFCCLKTSRISWFMRIQHLRLSRQATTCVGHWGIKFVLHEGHEQVFQPHNWTILQDEISSLP